MVRPRLLGAVVLLFLASAPHADSWADDAAWAVHQRSRPPGPEGSGKFAIDDDRLNWDPHDTAVILAPLNCPSARAKQADAMAEQLGQMGIPVRRSNSYSATITDPAQMPLLTRTNAVLGGEVPIVIINGMAKANPTVDEVALEFGRDK